MPAPPLADQREHVEERFGERICDPYHWLRERENPAVRAYLEAENTYTAEATAELRTLEDTLYQEMLGRIQQTDLSVPVRRGAFYYYTRTVEGLQYPIHCRKLSLHAPDSDEQSLLDLNQLAQGHSFCALGSFQVSDDDALLAYTLDTTGMRRYSLYVKDLTTGETGAALAERVTSLEWARDTRLLWYTTEDETTKRSDRLFRLELGGRPEEIHFEPDELYHIGVQRTRDRAFLLLGAWATDSTEYRFAPAAEPQADWRVFLPRRRDHKYDLDHRDGVFYIRTNHEAKDFRVLMTPATAPNFDSATEFMPAASGVLIENLDLFRDFAVAYEINEGLARLRVFDFGARRWNSIPFPEPVYAANPAGNPEYVTSEYRYSYQSLVTPPSIFDFDTRNGESILRKQQPVLGGYDPAQYQSERLWASASDETRVPISIVWRKGYARPGPLLLYGYGAYGYGLPASFSIARLSLLDRGVTYAIAHVRGGNEMGEAWHDGGMLRQKRNTFNDFIACAEELIRSGWTTPGQLAMQGGSAGGLLIGAVLNLRPELFRAAHLAVPFVDVMNTMLDASLPLTVGEYLEWGDPNQPEAYAYMRSYSPYDNLTARDYPAILVTTSLNDSQVMYWEPAKYVAKLRRLKTNGTPLLLKTNLGAGHGGASGRYDRLRETAFEFAWLLQQLGAAPRGNWDAP